MFFLFETYAYSTDLTGNHTIRAPSLSSTDEHFMAAVHDEQETTTPSTIVNEVTEEVDKEKTSEISHFDQKRTKQSQHNAIPITTVVDNQEKAAHDTPDLERVQTIKQPLVEVSRSERRGLFARFAVIAEVTEPTHYSNKTKWLITAIVAVAAAAAPVGSSIIFPVIDEVVRELNTTPTRANLSVALYMLAMAIFPLWWSAFSETLGRRTIYLASFAMFIVFGILSAESQSIAMLVVMRLFTGGASASVQAVGAGTVADLWESHERGRAMGYFYLGPLLGPLLAPIIGGILGEALGWRATQWALAVYGFIVWFLIFFALPETLKARKDMTAEVAATSPVDNPTRPPLSRTSTRESVQQKSKEYVKVLRMLFVDPLLVIGYLRFPAVLFTVYYSAVTFGSLYVLAVSIQYSFHKPPYEYSSLVVGALYAFNAVGYILSSILGGRWMDRIMTREARRRQKDNEPLVLLPEDRMRENAWLGALLYPIALIWYGWTVEKHVFWLVPVCTLASSGKPHHSGSASINALDMLHCLDNVSGHR